MLVAPKVLVPTPETATIADVPVRTKVAPLETEKFLPDASVMPTPPLFSVPVCTLKFPATLADVIAAPKVAPLAPVLLIFRLL